MPIKIIGFSLVLFIVLLSPLHAQDIIYERPSWWFGGVAGANVNFYRGSTQQLNENLITPVPFHSGLGLGLFLGPVVEYYRPQTRLGFMFQAGYDGRSGKFKEVLSPCNCPRDLSVQLSYISLEPSLRYAPFRSNLYFFGGPRLAFNLSKSFTYKQRPNPEFPGQIEELDIKGDMHKMNSTLVSMQIGAGYDIPLSSPYRVTKYMLSPFVSFQPYLGQEPRSIETWNITTFRIGVVFKVGHGRQMLPLIPDSAESVNSAAALSGARFTVNAPRNIPGERRVRETFPLRNYIFFDLGSTEIPDRYVLLSKEQVKGFKESQLEEFKPKRLSGRSSRQMIVYYNLLNILGDRMQKNPQSEITLVGSSEKGPEDGRAMAQSVKDYLVNIFNIRSTRILLEGRDKPRNPSEQEGATRELELLREGDRRVSVESESPALLMEFQSGPSAPLKPVEIVAVQEAPLDSYVSFNADGGKDTLESWTLELKDNTGKVQTFGPYTQEEISIPGKSILDKKPEGTYKVSMIGMTKDGRQIRRDTTVHMVLWTPPENEEGMRYSVIFEFNESKTTPSFQKYLTDIVTPKIPVGGTVIIHGYTDVIGDVSYNQRLSLARSNDVKSILQNSLAASGRNDVKFEVHGFGEDLNLVPFGNQFPEERFYNRTVVIDIIPH